MISNSQFFSGVLGSFRAKYSKKIEEYWVDQGYDMKSVLIRKFSYAKHFVRHLITWLVKLVTIRQKTASKG